MWAFMPPSAGWTASSIQLSYDVWAAQYFTECQYSGQYGMWQYTSSGNVPGIQGGVDMNECYQDYPKAIKE